MSRIVPYLAVFAALVMFALVVPSAVDTIQIAREFSGFTQTEARVISKREQRHQRGPTTGVVEFEYDVAGTTYKGDNGLTRFNDAPERIEELVVRKGGVDRIQVFYDPAHPRRVVIHEVNVWPPLGLIALALLLLVGGVHSFMIDKRRRELQQRSLASRPRKRNAMPPEAG